LENILTLVKNPQTSPEILTLLYSRTDYNSNSNYYLVRYLSDNPNTPTKVLESILNSYPGEEDVIKINIARHPNISDKIAKHLMGLNIDDYKFLLARNPKTPSDILTELATDKNEEIKKWVLVNPNTPLNIRNLSNKLKEDFKNQPEEKPELKIPSVEKYYTQLPNFQVLPKDTDEVLEIAKNPNISNDILDQLLKLENEEVNKIMLMNPSIPETIKQKLRKELYMEKYVDQYIASINIINDILKFANCYYNSVNNV
jgi:hypothetical protein